MTANSTEPAPKTVAESAPETRHRIRPEYVLIGALLLVGAVAVPAVADVYLVQSLVLSICAGLGIQ